MDYVWGEARVSFPDWQGTVQIDQIRTRRTLNEITGVPDEWVIVGLDWGGGEELDHRGRARTRPHRMSAIVVPAGTNIADKINEHGELEVSTLALHDVDPYTVIKAMTHLAEFRMRSRHVLGATLRVTSAGDVPEQPAQ